MFNSYAAPTEEEAITLCLRSALTCLTYQSLKNMAWGQLFPAMHFNYNCVKICLHTYTIHVCYPIRIQSFRLRLFSYLTNLLLGCPKTTCRYISKEIYCVLNIFESQLFLFLIPNVQHLFIYDTYYTASRVNFLQHGHIVNFLPYASHLTFRL